MAEHLNCNLTFASSTNKLSSFCHLLFLDVPSKRAVNWTFHPSMYTFILPFFPFFFFLIGTSQGAALINLESGGLSWVCRSKSDIFSQQFDHSVILDINPNIP